MLVPMRFELRDDFLRHVHPSAAQRRWWWAMIFLYVVMLGGMVAAPILQFYSTRLLLILLGAAHSIMIVTWIGSAVIRRRERRRLLDNPLLPCCTCRQPVIEDGDGVHVRCPECGLREKREQLVTMWETYYRAKLPALRTVNAAAVPTPSPADLPIERPSKSASE